MEPTTTEPTAPQAVAESGPQLASIVTPVCKPPSAPTPPATPISLIGPTSCMNLTVLYFVAIQSYFIIYSIIFVVLISKASLSYFVGAKDIKISNTDTIVEHLDAKGVVGIQNMSPIHNRRRARGGLPGAWNPYTDRINYSLEHSGTTLRVVSVSDSIFCTVSSFDDGICIESHASERVNEIKDAIDKLKECRKAESDPEEKQRIKETIKYLKKVLRDVEHAKRVGKTVGSHVGSKAGAAVGTCIAGPVGTVAGSVIGRIVGRVTGVLAADELERHTREESAGTTVKRLY